MCSRQQQATHSYFAVLDDLLFLAEPTVVDKLFTDIQQHLLLRPTGDLTVGNTINFLGRNITNNGDYYEVSLSDKYTTDLLQEAGLANSKAAPAPGTKVSNTDLEQPLNTEEHKAYRRAVGKLQWMTYTRPDISYATKELSKILNRTNNSRSTEAEASTETHQRNAALQVLHQTNGPKHRTSLQMSMSTSTATGQDVQQRGSQLRALSSSSLAQRFTSAAARNQQ